MATGKKQQLYKVVSDFFLTIAISVLITFCHLSKTPTFTEIALFYLCIYVVIHC